MKIALVIIALFSCSETFGQLTVNGRSTGENLYVQNPLSASILGYCTDSIYINDQKYLGSFNQSAYEIKLDSVGIQRYDSVRIVIYHQPDCRPKILLPTHRAQPTSASELKITETGVLSWKYKGAKKQHFTIEAYKWNRWIEVGVLAGEENNSEAEYSFQCDFHSGNNKYRVVSIDSLSLRPQDGLTTYPRIEVQSRSIDDYPRPSASISIESGIEIVKMQYNRKTARIEFSTPTAYQIYNARGQVVQSSTGKVPFVCAGALSAGKYYLNFDNQLDSFRIKD